MSEKRRGQHTKENREILEAPNHESSMSRISVTSIGEKVSRRKKRKERVRESKPNGFGFLMIVGVPLTWSVIAGLISTTEFERDYLANLIQVTFVVGVLGLIFTHKYAIRAALALFACFVLFILWGFFFESDPPSLANEFAALLTNTFRYVIGIENHTMMYQQVVVWVVTIAISLFVVLFLYYRFVFILLFSVLSVAFGLLITSIYFTYPLSFFVFLVCVLVLLVRQMHLRSSEKTTKKSPYTRLILPVTVACFFLVGFVPMPEEGAMQGSVRTAILRPFNFINDTFYNVTQRRNFSIRQIGFGGAGGRLGGSVEVNHEVFMRIRTDGTLPLYLTGATSDTYTGYSWVNTFAADTPVDFTLLEQNLELLERLLNYDVIRSPITLEEFRHIFDESEGRNFAIYGDTNIYSDEFRGGIYEECIASDLVGEVAMEMDVSRTFRPLYERLEVDVHHFRPSFVFHSGILQGISTEDGSISFLRDREGRVTTNHRFQRNTRYEVLYSQINQLPYVQNRPPINSFYGFLGAAARQLEHELFTVVEFDGGVADFRYFTMRIYYVIHLQQEDEILTISQLDLLNNYLIPRRNEIYETYTRLPEEFPERIRERAIEVTIGALSNYHMMRLLEEYLSQNYTYTLTPQPVPEDQDFVDHFLFDTREGHCVYFATAFVTMARSLGMPARYVEGFLVNGVPAEDGFVNVLNSMAHAWPEVYFEGYGWHRFEPTPATGLLQLSEIPEGASPDWNPWADPDHFFRDVWEPYRDSQDSLGRGAELGNEEGAVARADLRNLGFFLSFWTIMGWLLLLLIMGVIVRALWVYLQSIGWRKKENRGAVIHAFGGILSYLKVLNCHMEDGETLFRFVERVGEKIFFFYNKEERVQLERAVMIYGKARYSNQEISRRERLCVEDTARSFDKRAKAYLGRPKYYFYRYVLARV